MRNRRRSCDAVLARRCRFWLATAICLWTASASADYRLQPSDVLEFFVAGTPGLNQKVVIDLDGNAVFPLLGQMKASGRTLAEVQAAVNEASSSKTFVTQTEDGVKTAFLDPQQVTVSIAEYRPIYVRGDVAKPGEQLYRAGMTVRHAIAAAGGYDLMRFSMGNPFLQSATLRTEYDTHWIEYAHARAVVARIEAELAGNRSLDESALAGVPAPQDLLKQIVSVEAEQLGIGLDELASEKKTIEGSIELAKKISSILQEQQVKSKEDMDADAEDMDRARGLFERGTTTVQQITQARQALLASSIRYLATTAQLGSAEQDLQERQRELVKVEAERRLELLSDLEEAKVGLAKVKSQLGAVAENLLYIGAQRSDLLHGLAGEPKVMIYGNGDEAGRLTAENDVLSPGDVVEVILEPPRSVDELVE